MREFQIALVVFAAFLSFVPVVELYQQRRKHRFKYLSVFMTLVFAWSLNMILKYVIENLLIAYYIHLTLFPIIFLLSYFLMRTIHAYIYREIPTFILRVFPVLFLLHLGVTVTNDLHQWMLPFTSTTVPDQTTLFDVHLAPAFIVHTLLSYTIVLYSVARFLLYYGTIPFKKHYRKPFLFFVISIIVALVLNFLHINVYALYVDPTYFTVVLFSYGLYYFMYKSDFYFALLQEGRRTILDGMREDYVLTTENGQIIEVSSNLSKQYNLNETRYIHELITEMEKHAILYDSIDDVSDKSDDRPYYYTKKNKFELKEFNIVGYLYLFYNETKFVRLFHQLEEAQSHDIMTGLYNRNFLENNYAYFDKTYPHYGLLLADINGLKLFNDNFGHRSGDDLIKRFVAKLNLFEKEDVVTARSGGDEFVVLVKHASKEKLEKMRNNLIQACQHKNPLKEISISVGTALRKSKDEPFESVFKRADRDLYIMKEATTQDYQERLKKKIKEKTRSSS